ncbi:hypothetical protein BJX63DRAFT_432393 [Aspergillus granulosus]|uniref:LysM domain-containing protein n=1 Tax=Aspergillus granulosus TaxID=176169 RepID=A0ABR4HB45_9EURO
MALHKTRYGRPVFALLTHFVTTAQAQLHLFNPSNPLPFSPECNRALTAAVNCTTIESTTSAHKPMELSNVTIEFLDQLCAEECKASVKVYRGAVKTACANEDLIAASNASVIGQGTSGVYAPIALPDHYVNNYNEHCLQDSVKPVGAIEAYPSYNQPRWTPKAPTGTPINLLTRPLGTLKPWTGIAKPSTATLAPGTRKDCKEYRDNTFSDVPCDWIAKQVSIINFTDWDSSLYDDIPDNAAEGSIEECHWWYEVQEGETCDDILATGAIDMEEFYEWNSSVKEDFSNLELDTAYCIYGGDL